MDDLSQELNSIISDGENQQQEQPDISSVINERVESQVQEALKQRDLARQDQIKQQRIRDFKLHQEEEQKAMEETSQQFMASIESAMQKDSEFAQQIEDNGDAIQYDTVQYMSEVLQPQEAAPVIREILSSPKLLKQFEKASGSPRKIRMLASQVKSDILGKMYGSRGYADKNYEFFDPNSSQQSDVEMYRSIGEQYL